LTGTEGVTISQAWSALWPILTALGGGYTALLGIIYKLLTDRVNDLKAENAELRATVKGFQQPLDKVADTSEEMNRTLAQMLDGIFPREWRRP
jgi:hypothetical protein